MKYLLDTVAISEICKQKMDQNFKEWLLANRTSEFYISAISIGEIHCGIKKAQKNNPLFAQALNQWLNNLLFTYREHILPFSIQESIIWGDLAARLGRKDMDVAIAATAQAHNLAVVTRNVSHFELLSVHIVNPWEFTKENN